MAATAKVLLGRTFCLAEDSLQSDITTGYRWPNTLSWAQVQLEALTAATATMKGGVEAWLIYQCHSCSFSAYSIGSVQLHTDMGPFEMSPPAAGKSPVDPASFLKNTLGCPGYPWAFCMASAPMFRKLNVFPQGKSFTLIYIYINHGLHLQCRHLYELVNMPIKHAITKSIEI